MSWLLDTCVLSEYVRKSPDPGVIGWLDRQDESSLFLSVISIGEIAKGILKLERIDPRRSQRLTEWLATVEQRFAGRIVSLDRVVLHAWARMAAEAENSGRTLPVMDGLLMASAHCSGLGIVTRNVGDFWLYPQIFDPWAL